MKYTHIFLAILFFSISFGYVRQSTEIVHAQLETTFQEEAPIDEFRQRDLTKEINLGKKATIQKFTDTFVVRFGQIAVRVLISLSLFTFLWGLMKYIYKRQDSDTARADGRKLMLWGLIGLFVMTSVWTLVAILSGVFGVTSIGTPQFNVPGN